VLYIVHSHGNNSRIPGTPKPYTDAIKEEFGKTSPRPHQNHIRLDVVLVIPRYRLSSSYGVPFDTAKICVRTTPLPEVATTALVLTRQGRASTSWKNIWAARNEAGDESDKTGALHPGWNHSHPLGFFPDRRTLTESHWEPSFRSLKVIQMIGSSSCSENLEWCSGRS